MRVAACNRWAGRRLVELSAQGYIMTDITHRHQCRRPVHRSEKTNKEFSTSSMDWTDGIIKKFRSAIYLCKRSNFFLLCKYYIRDPRTRTRIISLQIPHIILSQSSQEKPTTVMMEKPRKSARKTENHWTLWPSRVAESYTGPGNCAAETELRRAGRSNTTKVRT